MSSGKILQAVFALCPKYTSTKTRTSEEFHWLKLYWANPQMSSFPHAPVGLTVYSLFQSVQYWNVRRYLRRITIPICTIERGGLMIANLRFDQVNTSTWSLYATNSFIFTYALCFCFYNIERNLFQCVYIVNYSLLSTEGGQINVNSYIAWHRHLSHVLHHFFAM